jgi:hypothetical protein
MKQIPLVCIRNKEIRRGDILSYHTIEESKQKVSQNANHFLIGLVFSEYFPDKCHKFKVVFQYLYGICNTNHEI